MATLGIDIGGTKLGIGIVAPDGRVLSYRQTPLPSRDYDELLDAVARSARSLLRDHAAPVTAAGVAMAAWLSPARDRVVAAASLGWGDRPLGADLERRLGVPTVVHNDANAAAWAEWNAAGPPRSAGADAFVLLTLGTDVGGGVIVAGRLLHGQHGLAGEVGHLKVGLGDAECVCGATDCLAAYASGRALLTRARLMMRADPVHAAGLLAATGGDPDRLDGPGLAAAIAAADPAALDVLRLAAHAIAAASAQISRVIDHSHLVLGGGVSGLGRVLLDAVTTALAGTRPVGPVLPLPAVSLARTGNRAGVIGAALLATRPTPLTDTSRLIGTSTPRST